MIYGISDIHGDYTQATKLLKEHSVIDENNNWCANDAVLVCCGDSTDRGPASIKVLELFKKLQLQAEQSNGRVIHLAGNHDAMILCIVHEIKAGRVDPEHKYIFMGNGGIMDDAYELAEKPELYEWIMAFPGMCKVDDVLFQHCDGFSFYLSAIDKYKEYNEQNAAGFIKSINSYFNEKATTAWGAWNLFCDLTDCRYWDRRSDYISQYLKTFDASIVVHGHTGVQQAEPKVYLNGMAINIDCVMSSGYRGIDKRGCVLELDAYDGKKVVM